MTATTELYRTLLSMNTKLSIFGVAFFTTVTVYYYIYITALRECNRVTSMGKCA